MVKNSKLAKSISDVAWGQFLTLLEYKAQWYGKNILKIGRFMPSSKTCSFCGYKMEKLPLSINVSLNIRNFALANALGLSAV